MPEVMNLNCTSCSFIDPNYKPINITEDVRGWGTQAFIVLKNDLTKEVVVSFRGTKLVT